MRGPRATNVICHIKPRSHQHGLLQELLARRQAGRRNPSDVLTAQGEGVEATSEEVAMDTREIRSGQTADVFAGYHDQPSTLPQRF
ncbi:hypothetical protein DOTSEDRAFT_70940 [Dothistroma septosporum NZE10]|uniref:Uncharacterized protein n=1 Tax=Dothistroma septosporum (strain NZE10 / CBS 128990) TaxID=675120 RepID=N1PRR9_DOTSN|nr:hypothetical protein DOTSEDRAFT_70940 [Dothistroma septosporum NZE10]